MLRSRTMWFAYLLAALGALESNMHMFKDHMSPEAYGYVLTGIAMIVAVLRIVTTQPLKER